MGAPFTGDYKPPRSAGDSDGGHISVAVKKSTDPAEVWVSTSPDGITWSALFLMTDENGDALTISSGGKAIDVYQQHPAGSTRFVVTNGGGFMVYSDAYGAEDSWSAF